MKVNTLGNYVREKIPNGLDKIKKLSEKFVKALGELKTSSKSSVLKSIAGDNLHFIRQYTKLISTGQKTDMYE